MAPHQVALDQVQILIFDILSSGDNGYQDTDPIGVMSCAREAEEMATDKDTRAIGGDQGEGYGRVIWSPGADGRGLGGYMVTEFPAQTAAIL